jgi:hypothetical protein
MHIDFHAPNRNFHAVTLNPSYKLQHALTVALNCHIVIESNPFVIMTKRGEFELTHTNGNVRMTIRNTPDLTQYDVDCVCKEVRYCVLGHAWVRAFRFGYQIENKITDEEFVALSHKTAAWCRIRGGAMLIRATCPHCGIRNMHTIPSATYHHICGPKRIRERGEVKYLYYDCPGYNINPSAPRGLY